MPPRAIASNVPSAIARADADPVRPWCARSHSSTIEGGNLGAPPKPPRAASYEVVTVVSACSSKRSSMGPASVAVPLAVPVIADPIGPEPAGRADASVAAICPALSSIFARCPCHAAQAASRSAMS